MVQNSGFNFMVDISTITIHNLSFTSKKYNLVMSIALLIDESFEE